MGSFTQAVSQKEGGVDDLHELNDQVNKIAANGRTSIFIFIGLVPGKNNHCLIFTVKFF